MKIETFVFNPFMENTYLLYDGNNREAALIDAGCLYPEEQRKLAGFIEQKGLHLTCLLNTHLHLDHQFGNAYVTKNYGVKPQAAQADEFLISRLKEQTAAFGLVDVALEEQMLGDYLYDGQILNLCGTTCEVIVTPGHSPGGVCFYFPQEQIVFTGDSLFAGGIGRTDLPGGNYEELIRRLQQRIMVLPDATTVYCGHGPQTTIGIEKQTNPYL